MKVTGGVFPPKQFRFRTRPFVRLGNAAGVIEGLETAPERNRPRPRTDWSRDFGWLLERPKNSTERSDTGD